ncbi:hypothetical protein GCM10012286_60780 [Streptomyces lasiicapitis]|uniref:Uncharacterized protein n=1 Tax=Streptomyces lasiicapitis TaxID=1923961 RepID=A0ABQ2MKB2_9ACTN|nr:hypothetical protein GCM10012286_60780 [Streptomyces lasiicapitis]
MLAAQDAGGSGRETAEDDVLGVDHVPLASDIAGLRAVRTHFVAFASSVDGFQTHESSEAIMQLGLTKAGTMPVCEPLVTAPGNLRKGPSRENDQANTHNELEEYPPCPVRVKTGPPPWRTGTVSRLNHTPYTGAAPSPPPAPLSPSGV